jgi:hypothetical protein
MVHRRHAPLGPLYARSSVSTPDRPTVHKGIDSRLTRRATSIPNLPFFYLLYRAWSHWRAVQGGQHVKWLLDNKLVKEQPSKLLDELYAQDAPPFDESAAAKEQLLLSHKQIDNFTEKLEMPAVAAELDRAIWQVETSLEEKAAKESQQTSQSASSDEKTTPQSGKDKQI